MRVTNMGSSLRGQESVSIASFLDELDRYKPLPHSEEQQLAIIISTAPLDKDGRPEGEGVREAINTLVLHNMKFAAKCAKRYVHRGVPIDDLICACVPNMVRAAEKFQPGRGKYLSYAAAWIRVALQECVSRQSRAVSLPIHTSGFVFSIMRQLEKDYRETGRCELDVDLLVERTGRPLNEIEPAVAIMHHPVELNVREEQGQGRGSRFHWADTSAVAPDAVAQHLDDQRVVALLLEGLSKMQRSAVEEVYFKGRTAVEVAAERGVSRQAIDWTLGKAIANARKRAKRLKAMGVL